MTVSPRRAAASSAALAILALASASPAAYAKGGPVAITLASLKAAATLQVSISDVTAEAPLPLSDTAYGRNTSPVLNWTLGPRGTRSYVVLMQDPDAPPADPAMHWLVWNIPADVVGLPKGMRNVESPTTPLGAAQGANFHGSVGYTGPHPPIGDAPHHYHFQVFALNRVLKVRPGSDPKPVLDAMAGRVLASGELVATFAAPAPKAAKSPAATPG